MLKVIVSVSLDGQELTTETAEINEKILDYKYQRAYQFEEGLKKIMERVASNTIVVYDEKYAEKI